MKKVPPPYLLLRGQPHPAEGRQGNSGAGGGGHGGGGRGGSGSSSGGGGGDSGGSGGHGQYIEGGQDDGSIPGGQTVTPPLSLHHPQAEMNESQGGSVVVGLTSSAAYVSTMTNLTTLGDSVSSSGQGTGPGFREGNVPGEDEVHVPTAARRPMQQETAETRESRRREVNRVETSRQGPREEEGRREGAVGISCRTLRGMP